MAMRYCAAIRQVLKKNSGGLDPFFTIPETDALGVARETAPARGPSRTARRSSPPCSTTAESFEPTAATGSRPARFGFPDQEDLALTDLRSIAVQGL